MRLRVVLLMPDRVHMMILIPQYAMSQVAGFIKGKSALHLARGYGERKRTSEPGRISYAPWAGRGGHTRKHPQPGDERSGLAGEVVRMGSIHSHRAHIEPT